MSRAFNFYLQDILEARSKIASYIESMSRQEFEEDGKTIDAVVRNLEIIGEATKNIPDAIREANPDVPWRQMAGFRDVLIHNYSMLNLDVVWNVVQTELSPLARQIEAILAELESRPQ